MKIRRIEPRDYATIAQLENENWPSTSTPIVMNSTADTVMGRVLLNGFSYFLAVENKEILAALDFGPRHNAKTADHILTFGIMVVEKARDTGLATSLIQYFLAYARKEGYKKIAIEALSTNPAAVHLYEKLGFVQEGCQKNEFFIDGKFVDNLLYAYFL